MGNLVIFVVGLLNNQLVKVTETFTDILNYYVLETTANKFAVCVKVYVVKNYLKLEHKRFPDKTLDKKRCSQGMQVCLQRKSNCKLKQL